ncbi:hypothetical protein L0Y34_00280 [Candidatus Parcubacteria bacterium]|nr:hypothetical protein [Candidatus Parcubacteria bacterium]
MTYRTLLLLVVSLVFGGAVGYFLGYDHGFERTKQANISSFAECAAAGYPIMESYPEQCLTPDGKHFVRDVTSEPEPAAPHQDGLYPEEPAACPADAKMCSDGTAVGRTGPHCEFSPCPSE